MGRYDWHILEEPPYSDDCWEKVQAATEDPSLRPINEACAYDSPPVDKLVWSGLEKKAPDVVQMLGNMVIGLKPLNQTLAWYTKSDIQDYEQAAIYYLQTYEERWKSWVTPEAYERVKDALGGYPTPVVVARSPQYGGTLRLPMARDPFRQGFYPYEDSSSLVNSLMYSQLFRIDPSTSALEGDLVVAWDVSADGRAWTLSPNPPKDGV